MPKEDNGNLTGTLTREDVARLLRVHPDRVSHALKQGLACAVVEWDARGARRFDRARALRWHQATTCRQRRGGIYPGGRCRDCWYALEDCQATGDHLYEARHDCREVHARCPRDGEPCGANWRLCQPCQ